MLILGVTGWHLFKRANTHTEMMRYSAILMLPIGLWLAAIGVVGTVNKIQYGIFATNEIKHDSFLSAYGALTRVKHSAWQPYLLVPRSVREMIYRESPAFRELEPFLEDEQSGWLKPGCRVYPHTCGDIAAGWFIWALRAAVAQAGHYQSGEAAVRYYDRLAQDVNQACAKGKLNCGPERATMMPPLRWDYIERLPGTMGVAARKLIRFEGLTARQPPSIGNKDYFSIFEDLTHSRLAPTQQELDSESLRVRGWAYRPDSEIHVRVASAGEPPPAFTIRYLPSPDLVQHFGDEIARNSRFEIIATCPQPCTIVFYDDTGVLGERSLDEQTGSPELYSGDLLVNIESVLPGTVDAVSLLREVRLKNAKTRVLGLIAVGYQLAIPVLASLALISYLVQAYLGKRGTVSPVFVVNTALLGAIFARLLIISLLDVAYFPIVSLTELAYFPGIKLRYLAPCFPLLLLFIVLAIMDIVQRRRRGKQIDDWA